MIFCRVSESRWWAWRREEDLGDRLLRVVTWTRLWRWRGQVALGVVSWGVPKKRMLWVLVKMVRSWETLGGGAGLGVGDGLVFFGIGVVLVRGRQGWYLVSLRCGRCWTTCPFHDERR